MTTAGAWTPEESELETQQNTVLQSQNFLQNVVLPGAAVPCDWTAAVWTDPTTYCAGNWAVVGVAVVGVIVGAMALKGKR